MQESLFPRAIMSALKEAIKDTPVVCLLGPRQCGKTTLARMLEPKRAFVTLDEEKYYSVASMDPDGFINSLPDKVIIDEVQRVPELLSAIKAAVDRNRSPGRFLLTGSANLLLLPRVMESLAGRMEVVQLQPLSEAEKERHAGTFLRCFLDGNIKASIAARDDFQSGDLPVRLIEGGYPEPLTRSPARARQWHRQYLKAIIERDVKDIAKVKDGNELARLIELLALRSAELVNISNLSKELGLFRDTVEHYISILERLFLVHRLPAWHRNSAKRLIKAPKLHLVDSGLAATLAGLTAEDWLERRDRMGHLLESFVIQQVITQAAWTNSDLRFWHYRDKDKVEVDLVITHGSLTWGIEVKSAASVGQKDVKGLMRLSEQCGDNFQGGIVLYNGSDILPVASSSFFTVPLSQLWEK
ncbi:MAG: ATP-binding protein [Gallionella sp.]